MFVNDASDLHHRFHLAFFPCVVNDEFLHSLSDHQRSSRIPEIGAILWTDDRGRFAPESRISVSFHHYLVQAVYVVSRMEMIVVVL